MNHSPSQPTEGGVDGLNTLIDLYQRRLEARDTTNEKSLGIVSFSRDELEGMKVAITVRIENIPGLVQYFSPDKNERNMDFQEIKEKLTKFLHVINGLLHSNKTFASDKSHQTIHDRIDMQEYTG